MKALPVLAFLVSWLTLATPANADLRPAIEVGWCGSSAAYPSSAEAYSWNPEAVNSLAAGIQVRIPLRDRFAMAIGARYLEKGSRVQYATYPYTFNTASGEFRIREQYVVLPLLIEARPFPVRQLFVTLGPELGILLAANLRLDETRTSGGTSSAYQLDEDIREDLNKADWSLSVGAGWEFPIAGYLASLGFRYAHGLTDVTRSGAFLSDPASVWKNRSLEICVGVGW